MFADAAAVLDAELVAVAPSADGIEDGYRRALDDACARGPVIAAGISVGAVVAVSWALGREDAGTAGNIIGVIACLPPWTGSPEDAPASAAARYTIARLAEVGLDATIAEMRAGSPAWLGDELARSWRALWPGLPAILASAITARAATPDELRRLRAPVAIVTATDDGVHPADVGREWARALPHVRVAEVTLPEIGTAPSVLGTKGAVGILPLLRGTARG